MDYQGNRGHGKNLKHWKYIKREKVNGVWKYYYDYNKSSTPYYDYKQRVGNQTTYYLPGKYYNPNKDDKISTGELIKGAYNITKSNAQQKAKERRYDTNNDGRVGLREHIKGVVGDKVNDVKKKITDYRYDTDKDGNVSVGERVKGKYNDTKKNVSNKVRDLRYDTNNDGHVDVRERVKGAYSDTKDRAKDAYSDVKNRIKYDEDRDGKVSVSERAKGVYNDGKKKAKNAIDNIRYDTDRDGEVSVSERVKGKYNDVKRDVSRKSAELKLDVEDKVDEARTKLRKAKYDVNRDGKVGIREEIAGRKRDREIGEKIDTTKTKAKNAADNISRLLNESASSIDRNVIEKAKKYLDDLYENKTERHNRINAQSKTDIKSGKYATDSGTGDKDAFDRYRKKKSYSKNRNVTK